MARIKKRRSKRLRIMLARLKEEGKVRHIGVSNFSVSQMRRAQSIAPITSLQPPYSIVTRQIEEEILPFVKQHQIGVIVYSPMSAGLLTGAMTRDRVANFTPTIGVEISPTSAASALSKSETRRACVKSERNTAALREKLQSPGHCGNRRLQVRLSASVARGNSLASSGQPSSA